MRASFSRLPLFWKVLLPFLALIVVVGSGGTFLVVRDVSVRADAALDQELARVGLEARASLRDRELYLVESASFAANIEGMARAVQKADVGEAGRLLRSVLALKRELALVVATDPAGAPLLELAQDASTSSSGTKWADHPFVRQALADDDGMKKAGVVRSENGSMLVVAAPICKLVERCAAAGLAITGFSFDHLAKAASRSTTAGAALFDADGVLLARSGIAPASLEGVPSSRAPHRQTGVVGGVETATLYMPFQVDGQDVGTLAVSVPRAEVVTTARSAGIRLAVVVLVAMVGIILLGAVLSRSILAQVRPLVAVNRALGRGELSARVPVLRDDELGELARGVNQMAEHLQASYETLEARVEQRTDEVRRLLRDRTEFFAGISHELRTPLAIILTQSEMVQAMSDDGAVADAMATITSSATELLGLVNDILELARAETELIAVDLRRVDVAELLEELAPIARRLAAPAGVSIDVRAPSRLVAIADRERLRVAIINLVDNAIKYTAAGGNVAVTAGVSGDDDRHIEVRVRDSGVGIPAEVGDRVFEPFYRVPGTRPQAGQASSGLGLALSRRWVEAQRGSISWRPVRQGGTEFVVTVPAASRGRRGARATEAQAASVSR